jgi:hypothetical protein
MDIGGALNDILEAQVAEEVKANVVQLEIVELNSLTSAKHRMNCNNFK